MGQKLIGAEQTPSAHSTRARPLAPGFVLVLAVAAMSWGGPLVRLATAPPLAVAAWRLLFSAAAVAVVLTIRRRWRNLRGLSAGDWLLGFAAGAFLAAHFWSWITSLYWTSVASSVVLVCTQPIFVATLSALFLGERASRRQWLGIVVAMGGAVVVGWGDFGSGRAPLLGDLLALAGAVFAAAYYVIGRRLRQRQDLWVYIAVVYGAASLILALAAALDPATPLSGYPAGDWVVFAALAAVPMLIGHTAINYVLRYRPAYVANLATLGEPVGATLIAWLLPSIGETPSAQLLVGGVLIGLGIGLALARRGSAPSESPMD